MINRRTFLKAMATIGAGFSPLSALWGRLRVSKPTTATRQSTRSTWVSHGYGTGAYGTGTYPQPHVYLPIVGSERS